MLARLSRHVFHPLWDLKDRSVRLKTLRHLERTQWLSPAELSRRQWEGVLSIVRHAYAHVPYYRQLLNDCGLSPADVRSPDDFRRIPLLTKTTIQESTDRLISETCQREHLRSARTGGSTGRALTVYFDERCAQIKAAAALRSDRWTGWNIGEPIAGLWGHAPVADSIKKKCRVLLYDRMFYLDTMDLCDETMTAFVARWRRWRPSLLTGHAHSLFILARFLEDRGITDLRPKGIIATSMMLLPHEREVIERAFGCKVTDRYGCEEVGLIACECERHDGLHVNVDHLYVEVVDDRGQPVPEGESGLVVITDLVNRSMPFIRYRLEDVAIATSRVCGCGRGLPLLRKVVGRVADFLKRHDGSLVAGVSFLDNTLLGVPGIDQMQIVQEDFDHFVLNVVPMSGYGPDSEARLREEVGRVFGNDVRTEFRYLSRIPQDPSGKYRFAICKVR